MKKNVVVIGSGLAGSLICNQLINNCDVTLLELGGRDFFAYPRIDFKRKQFGDVKTLCVGGGGTTNLWHNGLMPINPEDVLSEEFHDVLLDADSYMNEAASNLYFKNSNYSVIYQNILSEMEAIAEKIGVFKDGIDCLIYPKKYKKLVVDDRVRAFYTVNHIDFISDNSRIKTINYRSGTKQFSVNPDLLILCAGALGTPKLVKKILLTFGQSTEELGTGLVDHPMGFVGKVKFKKDIARLIKKFAMYDKGDYLCRTAVRLKSKCGKYTCCAYFRPALTMSNRLTIYKYKSLLGASIGRERAKNMLSSRIVHPDILAEIFSHLFNVQIPSRIYNILLLFEQKRGDNRVYYNGDELIVDWTISKEELSVYNSQIKMLNDILLKLSDKQNIRMDITEKWLWSAAHHSGTIPLGDKADTLIDRDLKVKFCDNVFVCDGSVIQEHSYANTGLTIGQLAMRLADNVLRLIDSK